MEDMDYTRKFRVELDRDELLRVLLKDYLAD